MALTTVSSLSESFVSGAPVVADDTALSKDKVDGTPAVMQNVKEAESSSNMEGIV